jgi:hypothetical protein
MYVLPLSIFTELVIIDAQNAYPTPPDKFERLFYIQRTGNINTIVYDVNFSAHKIINVDNPINAYWIRYADNGETKPLSYIQKTFAYGTKSKKLVPDNTFEFNLVSYSKKKMMLALDTNGKPYVYADINGRRIQLEHIFVKTEGGSMLSFVPSVQYVEIFGKDPNTGAAIYEKIIP